MVCVSRDSFFAQWLPVCAEEPHLSSPTVVQANVGPSLLSVSLASTAVRLFQTGAQAARPFVARGSEYLEGARSFIRQQQVIVRNVRDLLPVVAWLWNSRKGPPPPSGTIRDPFVDQYVHGDENPHDPDYEERSITDRLAAGLRSTFSYHPSPSHLAAQRATQTSSVAMMTIICIAAVLVVI